MTESNLTEKVLKFAPLIYVIALSVWAGTAQTIRRVRSGEIPNFSIREWIGDIVISGFIGLVTYFFCQYCKLDEYLAVVLVSISAHMGARSIALFERVVTDKVDKFIKRDENK